MTNESIKQAFSRFWEHVVTKIGSKADLEHNHSYNDLKDKPVSLSEFEDDIHFIVTISTPDNVTFTCDKTYAEIEAAYNAKKNISGKLILENEVTEVEIDFLGISSDGRTAAFKYLSVYPSDQAIGTMNILISEDGITSDRFDCSLGDTTDLQTQNGNIVAAINEVYEIALTSEFITIDELGELEGATVELVSENDNTITYNVILNRNFNTSKILKLYEEKCNNYKIYAESSDGTRTQIKYIMNGRLGFVVYVTFSNTYYAKIDQYNKDLLIMTFYYNGTRGTNVESVKVGFNEETGDYIEHLNNYLCDKINLVADINNDLASTSYAPSTDYNMVTKGYVDAATNELNSKLTNGIDALILFSPNRTRFNITVGDDGVLTATEIEE